MQTRRNNIVVPHPSKSPEIGRWVWALQDARQRTLEELERVTPAMIDWLPLESGRESGGESEGGDNESSIGTILYHIAVIEADWLYVEVLEQAFPADVMTLFPYEIRDEAGKLLQVQGISLDDHLKRLEKVRVLLLAVFEQMELDDFRRVRSLPDYDVTPEWVLHHLMQHEAEHRSQIERVRRKIMI